MSYSLTTIPQSRPWTPWTACKIIIKTFYISWLKIQSLISCTGVFWNCCIHSRTQANHNLANSGRMQKCIISSVSAVCVCSYCNKDREAWRALSCYWRWKRAFSTPPSSEEGNVWHAHGHLKLCAWKRQVCQFPSLMTNTNVETLLLRDTM